jgi:hypothetical protein
MAKKTVPVTWNDSSESSCLRPFCRRVSDRGRMTSSSGGGFLRVEWYFIHHQNYSVKGSNKAYHGECVDANDNIDMTCMDTIFQ